MISLVLTLAFTCVFDSDNWDKFGIISQWWNYLWQAGSAVLMGSVWKWNWEHTYTHTVSATSSYCRAMWQRMWICCLNELLNITHTPHMPNCLWPQRPHTAHTQRHTLTHIQRHTASAGTLNQLNKSRLVSALLTVGRTFACWGISVKVGW